MDRHDLECAGAMLVTCLGLSLNVILLQAMTGLGLPGRAWVLVPVFAGLAVGFSGFVEHMRTHGRTLVLVDRIFWGSLVYLALSALVSYWLQPRLD